MSTQQKGWSGSDTLGGGPRGEALSGTHHRFMTTLELVETDWEREVPEPYRRAHEAFLRRNPEEAWA